MPDTSSSSSRDRVRASLAEALARRACAHAGAARHAIEARLAALGEPPAAPAGPAAPRVSPGRGPLAALVADAARQKPLPVLGAAAPRPPGASTAADRATSMPAGRTLQFFQRTWSRLSAEQRLAQSRASLPDNAGPLNSQHLVHRLLTLMNELSPEYLEHFVAYIDALQWLEQANEADEAGAAAPRRSAALRR